MRNWIIEVGSVDPLGTVNVVLDQSGSLTDILSLEAVTLMCQLSGSLAEGCTAVIIYEDRIHTPVEPQGQITSGGAADRYEHIEVVNVFMICSLFIWICEKLRVVVVQSEVTSCSCEPPGVNHTSQRCSWVWR